MLTLRIERTLDNRDTGERVRFLEAQNDALRARVKTLERQLADHVLVPGIRVLRVSEVTS
jgi:basic region leucine zipper protein